MEKNLYLYNTLTRKKEIFKPLNPPNTGLYVCGPTVYGEAHLGHARPAVTFDIVFRYLMHLGYKVRYVRNITDVGHLVDDADEGEDKIAKKARIDKLEPMEVVQMYTNNYHRMMEKLNVLSPSIEPRATGHIIEQQKFVEKILQNGFAYEKNGSVYFDLEKYSETYPYGILSGRKLEDMLENTRVLEGQDEKKNKIDFALWKKASPTHIMHWPSPWSEGFPGWHLECSVMSTKYLGKKFDIHGGGMDLLFPHHECEIAQNKAVFGEDSAQYWMHNNMITINGQKMGKSLNNFITLNEFFTGTHQLLEQAFSPIAIRFFILQAHYRSTLDFSNDALKAAEKGLDRLLKGIETLENLKPSGQSTVDVDEMEKKWYDALNDDFNTPVVVAAMFDGIRKINSAAEGKEKLTAEGLKKLQNLYHTFTFDILGLREDTEKADTGLTDDIINMILTIRQEAKENKDFVTADKIRERLGGLGIVVKDVKDGFEWKRG